MGLERGKKALEFLFWAGRITPPRGGASSASTNLTERALPREVVETPTPPEAVAQRHLLTIAARALGVATERDLRDYFRLDVEDTKLRLAELVEEGALLPVSVEGWKQPAFTSIRRRAIRGGSRRGRCCRRSIRSCGNATGPRPVRLRYRLEIYTPAEKRCMAIMCCRFCTATG